MIWSGKGCLYSLIIAAVVGGLSVLIGNSLGFPFFLFVPFVFVPFMFKNRK